MTNNERNPTTKGSLPELNVRISFIISFSLYVQRIWHALYCYIFNLMYVNSLSYEVHHII